jgi:hypothetical protein
MHFTKFAKISNDDPEIRFVFSQIHAKKTRIVFSEQNRDEIFVNFEIIVNRIGNQFSPN